MKKTQEQIKELYVNNEISFEECLTALVKIGHCPNVLFDDNKYWAISGTGFQEVAMKKSDLTITSYVQKQEWKKTLREAMLYYLEN